MVPVCVVPDGWTLRAGGRGWRVRDSLVWSLVGECVCVLRLPQETTRVVINYYPHAIAQKHTLSSFHLSPATGPLPGPPPSVPARADCGRERTVLHSVPQKSYLIPETERSEKMLSRTRRGVAPPLRGSSRTAMWSPPRVCVLLLPLAPPSRPLPFAPCPWGVKQRPRKGCPGRPGMPSKS